MLEVPAGTPAAAAGLRATYRDVFGDIVLGDIIVGMDTRPIRSTADLIAAFDERRPGDKVCTSSGVIGTEPCANTFASALITKQCTAWLS